MHAGRCPATVAVIAIALGTTADAGADPGERLARLFGDWSGCALVHTRDRYDDTMIEYGVEQCRLPQSPCSTFKIPNALIGLQTGAVDGPDAVKAWDGVERTRPEVNRDHDLASAIRDSVVWYFQALARDIGSEAMAQWLAELEYGNQDISGGIDRFWLGSSLKIDAYGQLDIVQRLYRGALPFRETDQEQVRDMLAQRSDLAGTLYGKTGSCLGDPDAGTPDHGWFVGWVDWTGRRAGNPATSWFVFNLRGDDARGSNARDIAVEFLASLQP